jgi:hypothetical protein
MSIAELPASMPTHLDLPDTDNKPVDNFFQTAQAYLLTGSLRPHLDQLHPDGNYIVGSDSGIYWTYKKKDPLSGCKAPDFFYVPGVPNELNGVIRRSYVMWQEGVSPLAVMEFVSGDGSEERDDTPERGKFWVYERGIQARFYVIFDSVRRALEVFELIRGRYKPLKPEPSGRFRITPMKLDLGIWEGTFHSISSNWLRAWDLNGRLIPSPEEVAELRKQETERERNRAEQERNRAEQERNRAEQERNRAEQERQRADALATRLRELGIDPDKL